MRSQPSPAAPICAREDIGSEDASVEDAGPYAIKSEAQHAPCTALKVNCADDTGAYM